VKAKDAAEVLDADRLIERRQALRKETLDVLAEVEQSRDSQMMLRAQLRLRAEMLGQCLGQRGVVLWAL